MIETPRHDRGIVQRQLGANVEAFLEIGWRPCLQRLRPQRLKAALAKGQLLIDGAFGCRGAVEEAFGLGEKRLDQIG